MGSRRLPGLLFGALLVSVIAGLAARTVADADLWGNIRLGQAVLASGTPVARDPYSFTSDQPWINHEWLAEACMAIVYNHAGIPGLLCLSAAVAFAILLLTAHYLRSRGVGEPAIVGLVALLFLGIAGQLSVIRPQLFSALLFVVLLLTLRGAEERSPRLLLWVLPICAAWANLHGGWIVGVGVVGLWSVVAFARHRLPLNWAATATLCAVAGSMLTPHGWRLWVFLWQTVGIGRPDIDDWQPVLAHPGRLLPWGLAVAVGMIAWRRRRAEDLHLFPPVAVLGLLAFKVVRLDVSFIAATVILLGSPFAGLGPERFRLSRRPTRGELLAVGLLVTLGMSVALFSAWRTATCLPVEGEQHVMPEAEAILFIQRNELGGKLVSWYNYGHYAIWHLAPALKVSYDGRRETVYSEAVRTAHTRFYRGIEPDYARQIGADYVWLPKALPVVGMLPAEGWVQIFEGARSVVFARRPGAFTSVPAYSGPRCFPGP